MNEHTEIAELLRDELGKEYTIGNLFTCDVFSEVRVILPSDIPQETLEKISCCGDLVVAEKRWDRQKVVAFVRIE